MPPKRGRGRPRRNLAESRDSNQKLPLKINVDTNENISNEVEEYICSSCEKSFKSVIALKGHLCSSSGDESGLRIDEGQEKAADEGHRERRKWIRKARQRKPFMQCTKCEKVFKFHKSFNKHMTNEHSETPNSVKCDQCYVTCPNKEVLLKHINKKHCTDLFACEFCGKKFVRKAHVTRHLLQKGCDGRNLAKFTCGICPAKFTRKDNLMVHLRLQHISKSFLCKQCDYCTRNFSKLIIHTQNVHCPKPLSFECDYCGKVTSTRASMTKHLEIHGEKKYGCGVCGYRTYTIEVMRRHMLTHVEDKPYKCNICDNSYIQRAQLVRHLEKHVGFTCKLCDLRFNTRELYGAHILEAHKGTNNVRKCTFEDCNEIFKNTTELESHIKQHLNAYKCDICNKSFKSETNMRRHVATHTLDRPRRCMYCVCARAYVRGEHLLRHVRRHHPDVFRQRLLHVRSVLGSFETAARVRKSELEAILNVLDAESDRIISDYGPGVLYAGLQEPNDDEMVIEAPAKVKPEPSPLLSEEELAENLKQLLAKLIDTELLEAFGWPDDDVDQILERVVENCGARVADRSKWSRVQRMRENAKQLFLYAIEDKNIANMLNTHTIDQVIKHILDHVSDDS